MGWELSSLAKSNLSFFWNLYAPFWWVFVVALVVCLVFWRPTERSEARENIVVGLIGLIVFPPVFLIIFFVGGDYYFGHVPAQQFSPPSPIPPTAGGTTVTWHFRDFLPDMNVALGVLAKITEAMRKMLPDLLVKVIIAAGSALLTYLFAKRRYKQKYRAAAQLYIERLGQHIAKPLNDDELIVQGKSIVAVRDDLKSTILTLDKLLNSEIDALKEALKDPPNRARAREAIQILKNKWPEKSLQIEIEIRKLLAELGLERF